MGRGIFEFMMEVRPIMRRTTPAELLGRLTPEEAQRAPADLFVAGDERLFRDTLRVSVIGTRKASPAGLARAAKVSRLLVDAGAIVVSGLAEGIDRAAHQAALDARGRTVGVIGTPLDKVYPASSAALQEKLMNEHAVVSQFPRGAPIERQNFSRRNLTMALLVQAAVIVEAGEESGAVAHGWEALRLGRALYLMESLVRQPDVSWPNKMIAYGARVLSERSVHEFLNTLATMRCDRTAHEP